MTGMTFSNLKLDELKQVVRDFVGEEDAATIKTKDQALALLLDEGVTYADYKKIHDAEPGDPEDIIGIQPKKPETVEVPGVEKEPDVLVRMRRKNPTYQIRGYTFTKEHPFQIVPASIAQEIFDAAEDFSVATPREAKEYYS